MILAIDVDYKSHGAVAAGIGFSAWSQASADFEVISHIGEVADYESGQFYKRELPCLLALIEEHRLQPEVIIVDGFVYLDQQQKPGLGKHLYDALCGEVAVIGVAKNAHREIPSEWGVYRGESRKPLFVSSVGIQLDIAQQNILSMAGKFRMPTLLKQADSLCRTE